MKSPVSSPIRATIALACVVFQFAGHATTLVVTNNADSGPGTLRDALGQARSGDVITFDVTGIITNSSSDLVISNDVSISGPGPDALAVVGNTNAIPRIFTVPGGVTASVSGLTLRESYAGRTANGGGILNGGNLSVTNCVFLHCKSGPGFLLVGPAPGGIGGGPGYHGGAIYSTGAVTVVDCDFFSNAAGAGSDGAGGPGGPGGTGGDGGAIFATGSLLAMNCNFLTNYAGTGGAGGSGYYSFGTGSPNGSPAGNGGYGGAVYATGPATFIDCAFGYNRGGGGGVAGSGLSGTGTYPNPGYGGRGGIGGHGGAIFSIDQLTLTSCTFFQNFAGNGSSGGTAGAGYFTQGGPGGNGGPGGTGTVYCAGSAQITACTFYQNGAGAGGNGAAGGTGGTGAVGGFGGNGGVGGSGGSVFAAASTASVTMQNVLVSQNTVGAGGGAGAGGLNGSGTPSGLNGLNGAAGNGPDLFGAYASLGHNYVRTNAGSSGLTNGVMSDIVNTNLLGILGAFGRHGGRTLTCLLQSSSSRLVDAGDDSITGPPLNIALDQRGYARLSGAHVDIGAAEFVWPSMVPMVINTSLSNGQMYISVTNLPGLYPTPSLEISRSSATGAWVNLSSLLELAPGVYQTHVNPYLPEAFFRVRTP